MSKQLTFIPRSVIRKSKCVSSKTQSRNVSNKESSEKTLSSVAVKSQLTEVLRNNDDDDNDKVKEYSYQQRWPSPDEPVCSVCGKYGEYICDETDEDVCSIQCKQKHLNSVQQDRDHKGQAIAEPGNGSVQLSYESFDKFYERHFVTRINTSTERMRFLREKFEIRVKGENITDLFLSFDNKYLHEQLRVNLKEHLYINPTIVQMQVVPICLQGSDVLVSAPTGSGKTASFLIPILQRIHSVLGLLPPAHEFCKQPIALVLAPTRELCMQIEEQAKQLCKSLLNLKTALLIGGNPLPPQIHRLKHKIQLVIGTPGRVNDILDNYSDVLCLHQIKMVVLDEVDVMLNMGFHSQIQLILDGIPKKVQHLMFSATIPAAVESMVEKIAVNPIYVSVGLSGVPNNKVNQLMLWVEDKSKRKKLFSIIEDGRHFLPPVVVFVESKVGADMLCEALNEKFRLHCESIHSDKEQSQRTDILQKFLAGSYDILVSTNVMARGIDLMNVKQVIIFDLPKSIDEYVHQVGRAGRLENIGFSIAFINNSSKSLFFELRELFKITNNKLPDQVLYSPYLLKEEDKKIKDRNDGKLKRKEWKNTEVNPQSLLEILTKRRK